jgi:nicotinate-nucleotide--dimethylbenzimidazole phosphoribosyltransferase
MTGRDRAVALPLEALVAAIPAPDVGAIAAATSRLDRLTKPPGSLGRLEGLAIQLAGVRGEIGDVRRPAIVVFAADHGVARQGVSPYPAEVTRQMVAAYASGGAAINVLARAAGARLVVVDVGVAGQDLGGARLEDPLPSGLAGPATLVSARVRAGTGDLSLEPAMTRHEALAAVGVGRQIVDALADDGADVLAVGEMGIGNTTASSAIVASLTGRPPAEVTGRGTGLDAAGVARKVAVIETALARHHPDPSDLIGVLVAVGGLEIAALVGALLAASGHRIPVVLDGFITGAAALVAARLAPGILPTLIAGHRSPEPGHRILLEALGLEPLLELDLRLGEASGAALALPIVVAAARLLVEMATFESAGVADRA